MRKPRPKVKNCPCPDCSGSSGSVLGHQQQAKKKQKPAKFKNIKDRAGFDVYDEAKALVSRISRENGDNIPPMYHMAV
jgi:hypothetical protein